MVIVCVGGTCTVWLDCYCNIDLSVGWISIFKGEFGFGTGSIGNTSGSTFSTFCTPKGTATAVYAAIGLIAYCGILNIGGTYNGFWMSVIICEVIS